MYSCSHRQEQVAEYNVLTSKRSIEIKPDSLLLNRIPGDNYSITKSIVKKQRISLSKLYSKLSDSAQKNSFLDSASQLFDSLLLNRIVPYWYGTEWDFNGHTSKPNVGKIACGYFVSTTLRDMGLNLNRYELAKKGPEDEANSVAISQAYTSVTPSDSINEKLNSIPNGLYFVGLDNHVGYLYKEKGNTYFLHSNYIANKVMIEPTTTSVAFESSTYFISMISGNRLLMEKWLGKSKIKVVGK